MNNQIWVVEVNLEQKYSFGASYHEEFMLKFDNMNEAMKAAELLVKGAEHGVEVTVKTTMINEAEKVNKEKADEKKEDKE